MMGRRAINPPPLQEKDMQLRPLALAWLAPVVFIPLTASAAGGVIGSFNASSLQVLAGSTVEFEVGYSLLTSDRNDGGNDYNEPTPQDGGQQWVVNWYYREVETPLSITLQAGGQSFTDWGGSSGTWRFSMVFPDAGKFDITATGDWSVQRSVDSGSEVASRNCYRWGDSEYGRSDLTCSSWSYSYPQTLEVGSYGGATNALTLQIDVQAVPEPATLALWLAGLGVVAWRLRRAAPAR
jgi:hypothetical protein